MGRYFQDLRFQDYVISYMMIIQDMHLQKVQYLGNERGDIEYSNFGHVHKYQPGSFYLKNFIFE